MSLFGNNIRLRFAPSPTGFLHLGNLRSALFGYLLAKNWKGKFILRLEDTDQKREIEGALDKLLDILTWVGIEFDEGPHTTGDFGPYIQSERLPIYHKLVDGLLKEKKVYRCFCTEERLTDMRLAQEARKEAPRYDRLCRNLSEEEIAKKIQASENYIIRQSIPLEGQIIVHDELRGDIKFNLEDLDDQVLIKSDGVPTYHFANIVDDHLMKISHVTRGDEWIPSFPKNILLYQAFDWTPPKYIHLPLILNKTGGKLSKRQGDVFAEQYRDRGYLPEAIINFCALLGWHGKNDQEIYSLSELEKEFSLDGLGSSPAVFDVEKLDYYNGYYIRQKTISELTQLCRPYLEHVGHNIKDEKRLESFVALAQDRMKKLEDIVELTEFLFGLKHYDENLLCWKSLSLVEVKNNLQTLAVELEKINESDWNKEDLEEIIFNWIKANDKKNGDYLWPLRVSLTGLKNSPGPFEIASALGKKEAILRIEKALK
ncbi:MAG: glutamate--tRNA ligase [Candidatus Falkowbacteria bacterium]